MEQENFSDDLESDQGPQFVSEDDQGSDQIDNQLEDSEEEDGDEVENEDLQQHINVKPLKQNLIEEQMLQFYKKYKELNPFIFFNLPKNKQVPKSVCAKVISRFEQIVECLDCGMDESCIICMECFKNGNHEGHRFMAKKAGGGCCDCGDAEAWKPSGFCKNHTGEFVDFEVKESDVNSFLNFTDGLFYYYLYLAARKDMAELDQYSAFVNKLISQLNKSSVYYNKLTATALNRKLSEKYNLNQEMNNRTILENIFTLSISGEKLFHEWWETVINLFPYYPFKQIMVKFYIQNYDLIMGQAPKVGKNCATSITCQILTSHKLVTLYCNENTAPLAGNGKTPKEKGKMWDYFIILIHDLRLITDLQGTDAPLSYWRLQINSGLDNIFRYQDQIYHSMKKEENTPFTMRLAKYIHFCQIEFTFLETFIKVFKVINSQPALLLKLINYFYRKLIKLPAEKRMIPTLRPYHRCFALCLFKYFDYNIGNINSEEIGKLLKEIKKSKPQFLQLLKQIRTDIEETYFLYSKCLAQPGVGQSLYGFCYFYRNKTPFIAYIDLLTIKMTMLIVQEPIRFSFRSTIDYDAFDLLSKQNQELYTQEKSKRRVFFDAVLNQLNYMLFANIPDLYIYFRMERSQGVLYKSDIEDLIAKAFKENKNKLSYETLKTLKESIFTNENKVLDQWIKETTKYNKQRKQYELFEQRAVPNCGINFKNIWINLKEQNEQMLPSKSFDLLGQTQEKLWRLFFSEQTMLSLKRILEGLFSNPQDFKTSGATVLQKIATFCYVLQRLEIGPLDNPIQQIYEKTKEALPEKIAKQFGLERGEEEKNQKKKLEELKMKKLQSKKDRYKKNTDNLLKMYQDKVEGETSQGTLNQEEVCCSICKNSNPDNFVYLVRAQVRNHEKLLGIGSLECLSFSSCYHVFDYDCIKKSYNKKALFDSVTCPLCKSTANIIAPFSIEQEEFMRTFLERFTQIIFSIHSGADLLMQLCKSMYHYSLLASINLKTCIQKRLKIYKIVWEIIKKSRNPSEVHKLYQKFMKNDITRRYSEFEEVNEQVDKSKNTSAFMQLFQGIQFSFMSSEDKLIKNKKKSQTQEKIVEKKGQISPQYELTIKKIFNLLLCEDPTLLTVQFPPYIQKCFRALEQGISDQEIEGEYLTINNFLIEMPQKYSVIGSSLQCSSCKQISHDLVMCLLCKWVGCQNCPNGYFFQHSSQQHGSLGVGMRIRDVVAVYAVNKRSIKIGCLYEHELEGGIKLDREWDKFELNKDLYDRIEREILCDEIRISK